MLCDQEHLVLVRKLYTALLSIKLHLAVCYHALLRFCDQHLATKVNVCMVMP